MHAKIHVDVLRQVLSSNVMLTCRVLLMSVQSGTLIGDLESPLSLGLADGAMLVAMAADQCFARSA
jgi:hypothetical protein